MNNAILGKKLGVKMSTVGPPARSQDKLEGRRRMGKVKNRKK